MQNKLHPKIEVFLTDLAKELSKGKNHESDLEEISSHLQDAVEQLRAGGISEEAAVDAAIAGFGSTRKFGKALRAARRPWFLRWSVLLPSAFACSVIVFFFCVATLARMRIERNEEFIADQTKQLALFFKDQETLKKYPFLRSTSWKRDAGEFLNKRVSWSTGRSSYSQAEIFLSEEQRKLLKGEGWISKSEPELLKKISTEWITSLTKFDHWDLWATDGPGRAAALRGDSYHSVPIPEYSSYITFAKIHLLRSLKKEKALQALREVRHLALLIESNELLISSMIAVSILRQERHFYEEAVRRHLLKAREWQPIPEEDLMAFKRVAYSAGEWMDLLTPTEMLKALSDATSGMVGICGGVAESHWLRQYLKPYYEPRVWLELDLNSNYERIGTLIEKSKSQCRQTYYRLALEHPESWEPYTEGTGFVSLVQRLAAYMPFVRRLQGGIVHNLARPSWTVQYRMLIEAQEKGRAPAQVRSGL